MSFVYSPSHKIALPIHGLRFLSIRIQFLFPIDFKDGFQACHGIFFAERPPQQWQPHQQHAATASHEAKLCSYLIRTLLVQVLLKWSFILLMQIWLFFSTLKKNMNQGPGVLSSF